MKTASFFKNVEYGDQKPVFTVMLQTPYTKEIRIAFRKGQILEEHNAPGPIVVQVLEGEIDFGVEQKERNILKKGMIITLDTGIMHDLIANEQSIIRVSINTK